MHERAHEDLITGNFPAKMTDKQNQAAVSSAASWTSPWIACSPPADGDGVSSLADPGQDPRGAPDLDPLWTVLDTTPEGRGIDWRPKLEYGDGR